MPTEAFRQQYERGNKGETELDIYYKKLYRVSHARYEHQKLGIDRYFCAINSKYQEWFSVEYKTDYLAHRTGNIFIETAIHNKSGYHCQGWFQLTLAQALFYYIPEQKLCYCADVLKMKNISSGYYTSYKETQGILNSDCYQAMGVLVPIKDFELICFRVDKI